MFHVMEIHINMFTMFIYLIILLIHMLMLPLYLMPLHINMIMQFVMEPMQL